jgi:hypothetical protein
LNTLSGKKYPSGFWDYCTKAKVKAKADRCTFCTPE